MVRFMANHLTQSRRSLVGKDERVGDLYTGHALIDLSHRRTLIRCQVTRVYFQMSDRAIEAYVATGEPLKCAGCFALEGRGVYSWKT